MHLFFTDLATDFIPIEIALQKKTLKGKKSFFCPSSDRQKTRQSIGKKFVEFIWQSIKVGFDATDLDIVRFCRFFDVKLYRFKDPYLQPRSKSICFQISSKSVGEIEFKIFAFITHDDYSNSDKKVFRSRKKGHAVFIQSIHM